MWMNIPNEIIALDETMIVDYLDSQRTRTLGLNFR